MQTRDEVKGFHNCREFSQPSRVYIRLSKHRKKVFYCFYKITFPQKNAKLFVWHWLKEKFLPVAKSCPRSLARVISFQICACVISARKAKQLDATAMLHTLMQTLLLANQSAHTILFYNMQYCIPTFSITYCFIIAWWSAVLRKKNQFRAFSLTWLLPMQIHERNLLT